MSKNNYRPEYQAKLPKTDHNISQRVVFSSSVGHLLPIYHHPVNPGEHVYMDMDMFTRTQPLLTAAMVDIDEDVDVFFVPFPMLYTGFDAMCYQTNDYLSSVFEGNDYQTFPMLDFGYYEGSDDWSHLVGNQSDNGEVNGTLSAMRLFNHLRYNAFAPLQWYKNNTTSQYPVPFNVDMPNIFPYALLAYHAIYYKYFSLQDFERIVIQNYNMDKFSNSAPFGAAAMPTSFFKLHYVPYDFDYFQSTRPTPLISAANMSNGEWDAGGYLSSAMRLFLGSKRDIEPSDQSDSVAVYSDIMQVMSNYEYSNANTNNLRAAFALEKYLRVLGRADKNYDAQILAHFGVKVPHDVKHQITHLGHFHNEVHIGEVVSTAQTTSADGETGSSLGEIAGKGYGKANQKRVVDFQVPVHGVVMAVYYARPRRIYNKYGFDKINAFASIADLWNPEFDNLGAQPLFAYELFPSPSASGIDNRVYGWQNRFQERKQKYDYATLAFYNPSRESTSARPLFNNWTAWINGESPLKFERYGGLDPDLNLKGRLVQPSDLDEIFSVQFVKSYNPAFNSAPWLAYQGDPLLHDFRISCTLLSAMSKTGEPRLDF